MADIKDKIRKLLALAEGQANENESARAMEIASRLMMEHGISAEDAKGSAKKVFTAGKGNEFDLAYDWYIRAAQAVGILFGCKVVTRKTAGAKDSDAVAYFVGRAANVESAEETFAFVILQVEQFYRAALPKGMTKQERSQYRKTFKKACALRILERCQMIEADQKRQNPGTGSTALVISEHRDVLANEIAAYFAEQGVRYTKSRPDRLSHAGAAAAGRVAGSSVDLNRKVR